MLLNQSFCSIFYGSLCHLVVAGIYPYPSMPHMLPPDLSPGANPLMPPHSFAGLAAAAAAGGLPYGRGPSALVMIVFSEP